MKSEVQFFTNDYFRAKPLFSFVRIDFADVI